MTDSEIEHQMPLVKGVVRSMRLPSDMGYTALDSDDIQASGLLGLVLDARDFQKTGPFHLYALIRIRGAIIDELRRMDFLPRSQRHIGVQVDFQTLLLHHGDGTTSVDIEDYRGDELRVMREWIDELLSKLGLRLRRVVELLYFEGYRQDEVATIMGVTYSRVSQLHSEAIALMGGNSKQTRFCATR